MPIVFADTPRLRLRTATYFGVIDDITLLRAYRDATVSDASFDSVIDLSGVTSVQLTGAATAELTGLFTSDRPHAASARVAMIAPNARTSDVADLLQQLYGDVRIHTVASLEDALVWLGHATAG